MYNEIYGIYLIDIGVGHWMIKNLLFIMIKFCLWYLTHIRLKKVFSIMASKPINIRWLELVLSHTGNIFIILDYRQIF